MSPSSFPGSVIFLILRYLLSTQLGPVPRASVVRFHSPLAIPVSVFKPVLLFSVRNRVLYLQILTLMFTPLFRLQPIHQCPHLQSRTCSSFRSSFTTSPDHLVYVHHSHHFTYIAHISLLVSLSSLRHTENLPHSPNPPEITQATSKHSRTRATHPPDRYCMHTCKLPKNPDTLHIRFTPQV